VALIPQRPAAARSEWYPLNLFSGVSGNSNTSDAEREKLKKDGSQPTLQLYQGQVLEYGMLFEDGPDPNQNGFSVDSFLAYLRIDALLKDPIDITNPAASLVDPRPDDGPVTGGTFHVRKVSTRRSTYCVMQVSREKPTQVPNTKYYQMANPVHTKQSVPAKSHHELMATPIVPGTTYFELTRISDQTGNWQLIQHELKTKQREVKLQLQRFHVHDTETERCESGLL
jgi:hypothetical protein